jgi:UDP-N-acetyl-D-mannosaminuronate dehydrogenase|tara:strand:- start:17 stop:199 length:183 start_codon:yes stop_codon:yes gene_type:complete
LSKIAVRVLGYVGLPLAYEFSKVNDCIGYDISKIKNKIVWEPITSIDLGLKNTLNWYLND